MWTPGYWAWDEDDGDYYWVPGAWVSAPQVGLLWTPGYWGWDDDVYVWHGGYWGSHVGFYGGVAYGFGYSGVGYAGGVWAGRAFTYNRAVTNVGVSISQTNVYSKTVIVSTNTANVSFHGGSGGSQAQPTAEEKAALNERHFEPTSEQVLHHQAAGKNPDLKFGKNLGKPGVAATTKAGDFSGKHAVAAKAAGSRNDHAGKSWAASTQQAGQGGKGGKSGGTPGSTGTLHGGQTALKAGKPDAAGVRNSGAANAGKPGANFGAANRVHASAPKPGTWAVKPAVGAPKPGTWAAKPAVGAPKPGTWAAKPALGAAKPGMGAPRPKAMAAAPRPKAPAGNGKNNNQQR
jgi:hypothetical protein